MVCFKCGSKLILNANNKTQCPECLGIKLLSKEEALDLVKKQIDWTNDGFTQLINKYEKKRLIVWILGKREKISSKFFNAPKLSLYTFLSMNALVKGIMLNHKDKGKKLVNKQEIQQLIEIFSGVIKITEWFNLIKDDFGYIVPQNNLNSDKMNNKFPMANHQFVMGEDWLPIINTFKEHSVVKEKEADEQLKKFKKEYNKAKKCNREPLKLNPTQTIKKLYPLFLDFLCALNKNKIFKEIFNFDYLKEAHIPPEIFLSIVKNFPLKPGIINVIQPEKFKEYLKEKFPTFDSNTIYNKLVYSEDNQEIFPLFVKLDDYLFVSISFSKLVNLCYYPFYYKDLFVKESQNKSDLFEKIEVPNKFKENGFEIQNDIKDYKKKSTLQIDTLAWKKDIMYVIETKMWDITPLFENKLTHLNRERDLRGIVDGEVYNVKNKTSKKIPSLISKVEYVKKNIKKLCSNYENIQKIRGLIITKSHPPIDTYKDVKIIAFNNINKL